jgi:hypothetical protein
MCKSPAVSGVKLLPFCLIVYITDNIADYTTNPLLQPEERKKAKL